VTAAADHLAPPAIPETASRTYAYPRQVVFGPGSADHTGRHAAGFGRRAFLVTYPPGRTTATGGPARVEASLAAAGLQVIRHEIPADPDVAAVDRAAQACRDADAEMMVGVGGGGPLDAAKAAAMVAVNPGTAEEYQMGRAVETAPLPFVAVPTTVGTGSEATMVAVLRNRRAGVVRSIRDPLMIPPVAILDPLLLAGLPTRLLRLGACDALAHGIESFVSLGATAFTRAHSYEGVRLTAEGLRGLAAGTPDAAAAPGLLLGSYFAGVALQAGPGLAHVLAQPITAVTGIPHSAAIAALLPWTVGFNQQHLPADPAFTLLAALVDPRGGGDLAGALRRLFAAAGIQVTLAGLGARPEHLPAVMEAVRGSTAHIGGNPVRLDMDKVAGVLAAALAEPTER
jgi:alcohol dehydrogenase class IV